MLISSLHHPGNKSVPAIDCNWFLAFGEEKLDVIAPFLPFSNPIPGLRFAKLISTGVRISRHPFTA
jgi:hypothetical protein